MSNEENKDEYIFTTTDPLGREITLKSGTWNIHIIADNNRQEFIGEEENVKSVVEDPKFIIRDPIPNRERYYDLVHFTSSDKIRPVMVVVDHSSNTGDVCTAFLQSKLTETGERGIVYVRKK